MTAPYQYAPLLVTSTNGSVAVKKHTEILARIGASYLVITLAALLFWIGASIKSCADSNKEFRESHDFLFVDSNKSAELERYYAEGWQHHEVQLGWGHGTITLIRERKE